MISVKLAHLQRTPEHVLISGGKDKDIALKAAIHTLSPAILITDEQSARRLIDRRSAAPVVGLQPG